MDTERARTEIERSLLEAARRRAEEEGRGESEVIEEALRRYLGSSEERSFGGIFARVKERQSRQGVEPLSEEEAMKLAVEEQHAYRRGE